MLNTGKSRKDELANCNFAKTMLMLLIVAYHSMVFWAGNWFTQNPIYSAPVLGIVSQWMNTFHIFGFALISGYLFYYQKHEKGNYRQFLPFISNKACRLLIPYTFTALVWVIPVNLIYKLHTLNDALSRFLLGTAPNQLWFLLMLFNVFMLVWPFSVWFKNHDIGAGVIALLLFALSVIGPRICPNIFQVWSSLRYVTFFMIGFKIRQHGLLSTLRPTWFLWFVGSIVLFSLSLHVKQFDSFVASIMYIGINYLCNIVGAIMSFVILQKIGSLFRKRCNDGLVNIARLSMPIYLFHQQLIYVFIFLLNGVVNPYVNAAVNFVGSLILSILVSKLLMKNKVTRFLIGVK